MLLEIENWEPVAELLQRNNYAISSEKYLFIKFLIYFYRFALAARGVNVKLILDAEIPLDISRGF